MNSIFSRLRRRGGRTTPDDAERRAERIAPPAESGPPLDIAPNDPIIAFFQSSSGAVDIERLELDSPALRTLKGAGVKLVVPLVNQGELLGLINLGERLSEQPYSADDRKLLDELATHAAPAIRVAQLVREQEAEIRSRERMQQELRVAQLIQQQFLPNELPDLPGWHVNAYYQPAREVGGDFYDFIPLPGDRVGIVVGDVTDKGVPAALVMATTHSLLRAEAPRLVQPGAVLERVNELLVAEMPPNMFVTCLYAVLEPRTGKLTFANAGHNLPYVGTAEGPIELRATGMPLGLLPGMPYEETEAVIGPGERMLLHSDGLAEAHNPDREMFGFPRLLELTGHQEVDRLIDSLLSELHRFVGEGWEQEDDITLVSMGRTHAAGFHTEVQGELRHEEPEEPEELLAEFTVASETGNERVVMARIADAVAAVGLPADRIERLKTAAAEATMNAIEHGNGNRADLPVAVRVVATATAVKVSVSDLGGDKDIPEAETPDIEAKLAGLQSPRGWGLFLIREMVDELHTSSDGQHHTIELVLNLEGERNANQPV